MDQKRGSHIYLPSRRIGGLEKRERERITATVRSRRIGGLENIARLHC